MYIDTYELHCVMCLFVPRGLTCDLCRLLHDFTIFVLHVVFGGATISACIANLTQAPARLDLKFLPHSHSSVEKPLFLSKLTGNMRLSKP